MRQTTTTLWSALLILFRGGYQKASIRLFVMVFVAGGALLVTGSTGGVAAASTVCGNSGPATAPIQHVLIVMLENHSYNKVVGSSSAPYETSLANSCGVGTATFGATHTSAANYLALSAGEFPSASPPGCGNVKGCSDASNNLYHQMNTAGLSWRAYVESMSTACDPVTKAPYKIGHNPPLFYTDIPKATCLANDLPVTDLTAQSGALWKDLQNQTLPSLSWITPNLNNDGEGPGGAVASERAADSWLRKFMSTVTLSNSYQARNTLVIVTYDEGTGSDSVQREDCTNIGRDMPVNPNGVSAHQDSCHVPLLIIYPFTASGTRDSTFFDHYSVTKTVEDIFGLPHLAHANDTQTNSLMGHFGIH